MTIYFGQLAANSFQPGKSARGSDPKTASARSHLNGVSYRLEGTNQGAGHSPNVDIFSVTWQAVPQGETTQVRLKKELSAPQRLTATLKGERTGERTVELTPDHLMAADSLFLWALTSRQTWM
jgi:hypothetical protein